MSDRPIWDRRPERVATANLTAFRRGCATDGPADLADYAGAARLVGRATRQAFWPAVWEFCGDRRRIAARTPVVDDPTRMPGARWFPDARLNFAENLLRRRDDDAGAGRVGRAGAAGGALSLRRAARRGRARRRGAARGWASAPATGSPASCPTCPRPSSRCSPPPASARSGRSCSPDFGVAGRARPLRPDRAQGAVRRRRLRSTPASGSTCAERVGGDRRRRSPSVERVVVVPYLEPERRRSSGSPAPCSAPTMCSADDAAGEIAVRAAALRPPALHPVLLGHDRPAQVHRPRRRRHAAPAPQGARAAHRPASGGPPLLLHHLRLDDVELAGQRAWPPAPRSCSTTARPFHPRKSVLFDMAERRADDRLRHQREVPRDGGEARPAPGLDPRPAARCARCSPPARRSRPRASTGSTRRSRRTLPRLDLRRHRHHLLLRAGQPDRPGLPRRAAVPRASGMEVEVFDDGGPAAWSARRASWSARRPSPRCRSASGTIPTARSYRAAYFEHFPGIWRHGDCAEITDHGGLVIHGRSDATLNPGGVRIGTAEIYRQVEQLDEVLESVVIGQQWRGRRARRAVRAAARRRWSSTTS